MDTVRLSFPRHTTTATATAHILPLQRISLMGLDFEILACENTKRTKSSFYLHIGILLKMFSSSTFKNIELDQ